MKALKKQFVGTGEVKGFKFTQIRCTNRAFLYEVIIEVKPIGNEGETVIKTHYEVFKKVINKRYACISYPKAKYFGVWAWTYPTLEKATEKFNQLNQVKK